MKLIERLIKAQAHKPAGSRDGGQFAPGGGARPTGVYAVRRYQRARNAQRILAFAHRNLPVGTKVNVKGRSDMQDGPHTVLGHKATKSGVVTTQLRRDSDGKRMTVAGARGWLYEQSKGTPYHGYTDGRGKRTYDERTGAKINPTTQHERDYNARLNMSPEERKRADDKSVSDFARRIASSEAENVL